jgi:hypothetical protein
MEPTNLAEEGGLIRIVESKEDKITRLEKKAKSYDKISNVAISTGTVSYFGGLLMMGMVEILACGMMGCAAIPFITSIYATRKYSKVRKQLNDLYEKK